MLNLHRRLHEYVAHTSITLWIFTPQRFFQSRGFAWLSNFGHHPQLPVDPDVRRMAPTAAELRETFNHYDFFLFSGNLKIGIYRRDNDHFLKMIRSNDCLFFTS